MSPVPASPSLSRSILRSELHAPVGFTLGERPPTPLCLGGGKAPATLSECGNENAKVLVHASRLQFFVW
jgi:hypothetical protein